MFKANCYDRMLALVSLQASVHYRNTIVASIYICTTQWQSLLTRIYLV